MNFAVYYAKVSVEAKQFECANIIKSVLLIFDRIKNPFTLYYSIQGNIGHCFVFAPIAFAGRWSSNSEINSCHLKKNKSMRNIFLLGLHILLA